MSLKDELDQFHGLFKQHLNGTKQAALRWVTATEIDWDDKTMTAVDSDNLPYYDVLLGVSNVKVKPKPGTDCLIAILEGNEATAFLLYADEADLVEYNDGQNGGLANAPELRTQLAKMTARIDMIISAINGATVATDQSGAALLASLKTGISTINTNKESFADIEDTKITH
jgi:hypothetical protein